MLLVTQYTAVHHCLLCFNSCPGLPPRPVCLAGPAGERGSGGLPYVPARTPHDTTMTQHLFFNNSNYIHFFSKCPTRRADQTCLGNGKGNGVVGGGGSAEQECRVRSR
ncbi:hypothetical protein E2C01_030633 [Portunus trituberculatus]|uniref:Uncharacterized protein n=1 Tax=Portunus trituberculatus TaxID=210409 RepID=A0A5B7EQY2_PORTR|nr:hypothetical protein [Portunus trituberculatus]